MPFQKRFLKISEVCEYLSISLSKANRDIAAGILPIRRLGISVRIDKQKLDEMIETGETAKKR